MTSTVIWLLFITGSNGHSSPSMAARFTSQVECEKVARAVYVQSRERSGAGFIHGFCVPTEAATLIRATP